MNHEQIKAARAMLKLSQKRLAKEAGLSLATLNNIERGVQKDPRISTMQAIRQTLEAHGVEFTSAYEGIGVILKPRKRSPDKKTVLIIDDSPADRTLFKSWLGKAPRAIQSIVEADNARAGYSAFVEHHPDCVILDFKMYGMDGFQLLAEMNKDHARLPPIIFVTGLHNDLLKESAEKQGVSAYLNKNNLTKEGFHDAVERALA